MSHQDVTIKKQGIEIQRLILRNADCAKKVLSLQNHNKALKLRVDVLQPSTLTMRNAELLGLVQKLEGESDSHREANEESRRLLAIDRKTIKRLKEDCADLHCRYALDLRSRIYFCPGSICEKYSGISNPRPFRGHCCCISVRHTGQHLHL